MVFLNKHLIIQVTRRVFAALLVCFSTSNAQVLPFQEAKERADKGDAFAQAVVAMHYQLGWDTGKDVKQAARYAHTSAKANNALGLFRVGAMLRNGEGFAKDEKKGLEMQRLSYKALKDAKDPYSITSTAIMIFQGKAAGQNVDENERRRVAVGLYKKAADMGYAPAQFNYAMALNDGHGVQKTPILFDKYINAAIESRYPLAENFEIKKKSSHIGATDGVRWKYEFSELIESNSKKHRLTIPTNEEIILADDQHIVVKRLIYVGLEFGYSTSLYFYDARSLLLKNSVSVPNNVCSADYSSHRGQFVFLTISRHSTPWVKFPKDTGQALVLVDLREGNIERVPVWRFDEAEPGWGGDLYWGGGPDLAPRWNGDKIVFDKSKFSSQFDSRFLGDMRFTNSVFQDVGVELGRLQKQNFSTSVKMARFSKAGIELIKGQKFTRINSSDDSPFFSISQSDTNRNKFSILSYSAAGNLIYVNLSNLSSRIMMPPPEIRDGIGVFDDGSVYARGGSRVVVYPVDGYVRSVDFGELSVSSKFSFDGKELNLVRYYNEDPAAFVINSVSSDGKVFTENVALSIHANPDRYDQENKNSPKIYDFSLDGSRRSIAILTEKERSKKLAEVLGVHFSSDEFHTAWWEFDWRNGKLLEPVYLDDSARGMFGACGRFYGQAPPGWSIVSQESSTSDGSENTVSLKQHGVKNEITVGSSPHALRGGKPLVALDAGNDFVMVISGGYRGVQVERVSLSNSDVKILAQHSWNDRQGDRAFFVSVRNWLVIPHEGGFKILKIDTSKHTCEILAEVYFGSSEDYAILLPNGSYAGSPGCENLLRLNVVNGKVDASSLAPWRNRPSDVLKALGGDPEQIEILAMMTERWLKRIGHDSSKPEPTAEEIPVLSVEMPPLWAKGPDIEIPIKITPQKSPISNVSVRVNGVECANVMGQYLMKNNDGNLETVVSLRIAEGQNWIEVTAIDEMGRRSDSQRFRTILKETQSPRRYVVALGVSKYHKSEFDLAFAAKDAKDLTSSLSNTDTESLILTDNEVDGDALGKIQEFLAASQEDDEVILFCAGHGVLDANLNYVFARHDFDPDKRNETGIKLDDLILAVGAGKSLKRLILLDTCHSGLVGEKEESLMASADFKLPEGVRSIKQRGMIVSKVEELTSGAKQRFIEEMFLLPGIHRGVNIIGASGGAEYALESGQWNNGVFTASVIEGLMDKKADWDKDEDVSVSELRDYLGQRIPELTGNAQKPSVVAFERDQDFKLAR